MAAEIGRVFRPALGIVSDLNAFAQAMASMEPVQPQWTRWTEELRSLREAQRAVPNYEGTLNLGTCMRELETLLAPDAIVTTDAGNFAGWATRFLNFREDQRYIGPTNGAMGYSVPAAVGAKVTFPDRMVVAMVGDGGFMMTGQELATAFHHGVAPIVLVFNNQMYGTIRMHQERAYPYRVSGTALTNPDFRQVHRSLRRPWRGGHRDGGVHARLPARGGKRQAGGDRAADESRADHDAPDHRAAARGQGAAEKRGQAEARRRAEAPGGNPRPFGRRQEAGIVATPRDGHARTGLARRTRRAHRKSAPGRASRLRPPGALVPSC